MQHLLQNDVTINMHRFIQPVHYTTEVPFHYEFKSVSSCFKIETVNLQQKYFKEIYLHHRCYKYAKMVPIAGTWSKPLKACGAPQHSSWHGPPSSWWIPLGDPGGLLHGKLDNTPINVVIGLSYGP